VVSCVVVGDEVVVDAFSKIALVEDNDSVFAADKVLVAGKTLGAAIFGPAKFKDYHIVRKLIYKINIYMALSQKR
jgi:hypothetical protein